MDQRAGKEGGAQGELQDDQRFVQKPDGFPDAETSVIPAEKDGSIKINLPFFLFGIAPERAKYFFSHPTALV